MANAARKLADAEAAAARAEWSRVGELTAALEPTTREERVALAFLRARAALRAGLPAVALEALDALAGLAGRPEELGMREVLRGRALVALGRYADAIGLLEQTAAAAPGELATEAQLTLAEALVQADRLSEVEPLLETLLGSAPPGRIAARALALQADVEIRRARRPIAARSLRDALDALGPDESDPELRLSLQGALLAIAIQTLDLRLVVRVREELAVETGRAVPGPARARDLQGQLALGLLLLGEPESAWAIASAVRERAPAGVPAIAADLLGAQVARAAGESFTPLQFLKRAVRDAQHVAWAEAGLAGREVLLTLIESAATAGLPGAARLWAGYEQLPALDAVLAGGPAASRLAPLEAMARAAMAGARGEPEVQRPALRRAIAQWRALGDELGELHAVLALAQATCDPEALERADTLTSLVPRCWLRRRYSALAERARGPEHLNPAEWPVLEGICQGLNSIEIAAALGRSKNTIRNQTRRIFQVMHVSTRSALVAKCAAMGFIPREPTGERLAVIPGKPGPPARGSYMVY